MKTITAHRNVLFKKVKRLQRQNKQLLKKNESLLSILKTAKVKYGLDMTCESNLMINTDTLELIKNTISRKKLFRYMPQLRKFALTLHYYSPAAYMFVRELCNKIIPHPRTLFRWCGRINGDPGFTEESFNALKLKAHSSDKSILCSLV